MTEEGHRIKWIGEEQMSITIRTLKLGKAPGCHTSNITPEIIKYKGEEARKELRELMIDMIMIKKCWKAELRDNSTNF